MYHPRRSGLRYKFTATLSKTTDVHAGYLHDTVVWYNLLPAVVCLFQHEVICVLTCYHVFSIVGSVEKDINSSKFIRLMRTIILHSDKQ